jgi:hypothetical protein
MHAAEVQHMQDPAIRADFIAAGDLQARWRQHLVRTGGNELQSVGPLNLRPNDQGIER